MDKIQELHGKLFLQDQSIGEYMKDHATITEDLMRRFAEWVSKNLYCITKSGKWKKWSKDKPITTSELIQLFKQTL